MPFLSDYVYYSSGNECPEEYLVWGGLSILGHVLGGKVSIAHGNYFRFKPNIFVCLVGEPGSGKNTCLGVNMDIMAEQFPSQLVSASIQSREDIVYQMADDTTCLRTYTDELGINYDYRPFYILNNELASILSVDQKRMVEFFTDIYDGKRFGTGFKKDRQANPGRQQWFRNPHVSLIAGAVPTWFMGSLKMDLFSGGLGRRLIIVASERKKIVPFPMKPVGADAAMSRVIEHLKEADKFKGVMELSGNAIPWWEQWYRKHKEHESEDPILFQFDQTKPMQVLKVALLLRCTEKLVGKDITADHLDAARQLVDNLTPTIQKLTSGIGRNELAGIGSQVIDFIDRMQGVVSEKRLMIYFRRYLQTHEFKDVIDGYIKTKELFVAQDMKSGELMYFSPQGFEMYERKRTSLTGAKENAI